MTTQLPKPATRPRPAARRPVRVVHIIGALDRGGAGIVSLDLCRAIPPTDAKQTFITLDAREGILASDFRTAGAVVRQCPPAPVRSLALRLWRMIRTTRPDAVVSHICLTSGVILLLARLAGVPVRVARMHGDRDGRPDTPARRRWRALMRWLLRHTATEILGVTDAALQFAGRRAGDGRYRVLYNSVDATRVYGWSRAAARERWNLPADAPVLVHIGRAHAVKNRPFLLRVHDAARRLQPDTTLVTVGPGGVDDLVAARPHVADDPRVLLAGETEEIASVLAGADVLLLPSYREGLPGVVLEALAAGVPVIANDLPCLREIAHHVHGLTLVPIEHGPNRWARIALELSAPDPARRREISRSLRSSPFLLTRAVQEWRTLLRGNAR